jgi:HlyD family secretion protein
MLIPGLLIILISCKRQEEAADAYGNFEAVELMVSVEAQGRILAFGPLEGDPLKKEQVVAVIDSTRLCLKREQLHAHVASLGPRIHTLEAEVGASRVQLANLEREMQRIERLAEGGAATPKQKDDITGQVELVKAQIAAAESRKASIYAERRTLEVQVEQVEDEISRCRVKNPMDGILLSKYREAGELAMPGQVLYKIANLDTLILRAYISGNQLSRISTGKNVKVHIDVPGGLDSLEGVVSWMSPQAEFTPKIIQTREERVNLVYAIKVRVPNDGRLRIGMPAEVVFD